MQKVILETINVILFRDQIESDRYHKVSFFEKFSSLISAWNTPKILLICPHLYNFYSACEKRSTYSCQKCSFYCNPQVHAEKPADIPIKATLLSRVLTVFISRQIFQKVLLLFWRNARVKKQRNHQSYFYDDGREFFYLSDIIQVVRQESHQTESPSSSCHYRWIKPNSIRKTKTNVLASHRSSKSFQLRIDCYLFWFLLIE